MKNETKQHLLAAIAIALTLGFAGSILIGGDDEGGDERHYCQMVKDGLWPEFRKGEVDCAK